MVNKYCGNIYKIEIVKSSMKKESAMKLDSNVVGYIMGVISIVMAFFTPLAGLIFGIVGLVKSSKTKYKQGMKLNLIGVIASSLVFIGLIIVTYVIGIGTESFPMN